MSIADITTVDDLGYSCIDAKYLDAADDGSAAIAFSLTGKVRMPRTCLPEPCARALSQRELSSLTGTEMILPRFQKEWDEYYARYADFCRKEVVPFGKPALQPKLTPENFWPPLLSPPIVVDDLITNIAPPFGGTAPPDVTLAPPFGPRVINRPLPPGPIAEIPRPPVPPVPGITPERNNCTAIVDGNSFWVIDTDPSGRTCRAGGGTAAGSSSTGTGGGGGGTVSPPITPVPAPASLTLLGSGFAVFGFWARRSRRAQSA